jgi:DNA-binding NarL/FixJ family response regulator
MRLVERDNELAALHDLFLESTLGRGNVALVSGPVGSGKTEFLHAFAEQAISKGAVFLSASSSRAESAVPFGVLNQLCHSAPLGSPPHERMASLLDDMRLTVSLDSLDSRVSRDSRYSLDSLDAHAEEASSARADVMSGMHSALVELAEQHPVLIGIDDVSDADAPSQRSLLYLIRRLRSARVMVLLTESDDAQWTRRAFRTELLRLPRCTRLRLALLSPQGVTEILAEQLDGPIPPRLAADCHAVSGGNPLLVHALVEDHDNAVETGTGGHGGGLVVGEAFGQAVLTCLHQSEPATIATARGLAVLGELASPELLSRLLAVEAAAVVRALRQLKTTGVVLELESWCFRHDVARSAVLADTPPSVQSDLHRRAAELLYHKGSPAAVVAQHLVAAEDASPPWALPVLEDAAKDALRDDELHLALSCLELATRACADDAQQALVISALARAEWRANPATAVRHLGPLATALRGGFLRGGRVADLIKFMLWHGRVDEAGEALERASRRTADSDPEIFAEFAMLRPWLRSSYPPLLAHVHEPSATSAVFTVASKELTSATARLQLHAATALNAVLTAGADDDLVGSVEQLLAPTDPDDPIIDAVESALLALVYADRADRASQWWDHWFDVVRAPTWRARLASIGAEIALRQGLLPQAERLARLALDTLPLRSWGVAVGAPLATLVNAATAMGKHTYAAGQLAQPVPAAMFKTRFGLHYLHARGQHYLAMNRGHDALCDFLACGEHMRGWGIDHPALVPWRTDAATAHLSMGDGEGEAARLIREQLSRVPSPSRTRGISLRLLASVSEPRRRAALLEESMEVLDKSGDRFELARTLADLSHARRALGEFRQAQATKHQALMMAKECQAKPLRRLLLSGNPADARQATAPAEPAADGGPSILSEAEKRVAELASKGHTNREIATKLFITVSTVEQHLTRVYRKLEVRNRKDLPASLRINVPSIRAHMRHR